MLLERRPEYGTDPVPVDTLVPLLLHLLFDEGEGRRLSDLVHRFRYSRDWRYHLAESDGNTSNRSAGWCRATGRYLPGAGSEVLPLVAQLKLAH